MTGGGIIVAGAEGSDTGGGLAWATPAAAASTVTTHQRADPAGRRDHRGAETDAEPERVPVPALAGLAIALCTGVTVLFGVWPQPLIDFANHATLLFLPK